MQFSMNEFSSRAALALLLSTGLQACSPSGGDAGVETATLETASSEVSSPEVVSTEAETSAGQADPNRITREGVVIEFSTRPTSNDVERVMASDWADVTFRITDASTGQAIEGRYPAAWMDLSQAWEAKGDKPMSCEDRVSTYLQGIVGIRPMIDLNSHFLLVMNADASISVIDPIVGITGITNLFAQINLEQAGADWDKTEDQKTLFVTMPLANQVALIDTETFKVAMNIDAGERPTRARLQGDERYLWVGNNATRAEQSGVTIIDAVERRKLGFINTGEGHHEIAFSDDNRYAFVSNRNSGTVTVIDVQTQQKVTDLETGPVPISLAFSPLGKALYVADGKDGTITVVDAASLEIRARIEVKPGLGPMRFSQDGRWGIVVNPFENEVYVIDSSKDQLVHTIKVGKQPYQVSFTRSFAYIRSLATQDVGLIPVSELDEEKTPLVSYIPAGDNPPGAAARISIADAMVPSVKEAASYIVNQADGTVHYYMEGMGAPMGAFRNYGHQARAIEIVDRSLSEHSPGVYTGRVKIPIEGQYDVAFMMDTPRFLHCFSTEVVPNPELESTTAKMGVAYQVDNRSIPVGINTTIKFRLTDARSGEPALGIPDVTVLYYRSDGRDRIVTRARALPDGGYEATIKLDRVTTYYLFVGARSRDVTYTDLPFLSLIGTPATDGEKATAPASQLRTGDRS